MRDKAIPRIATACRFNERWSDCKLLDRTTLRLQEVLLESMHRDRKFTTEGGQVHQVKAEPLPAAGHSSTFLDHIHFGLAIDPNDTQPAAMTLLH